MSLSTIRPYLRTRLTSLGFREWLDAFNEENVPSNVIDKSFHILMGDARHEKMENAAEILKMDVTVTIWRKGFRNPADGIDQAMLDGDSILKEVLKPEYRLTAPMKNVEFSTLSVEPIDDSNDNLVEMRIIFTALVILAV